MALAIDLNRDSSAVIGCFLSVLPDQYDLLEAASIVCSRHDKKHIFIWNDIKDVQKYLEDIRKRSLFCWFLLIFELFDSILENYDIKMVCNRSRMPIAEKAMDYYKSKIKLRN